MQIFNGIEYQDCCCMPMYGPMHLILYHFEKLPGSLGIFVVDVYKRQAQHIFARKSGL